jgi:putative endonuclease
VGAPGGRRTRIHQSIPGKKLVWYEVHEDVKKAITREKRIKKWNRAWKLRIIGDMNPHWNDLSKEIA